MAYESPEVKDFIGLYLQANSFTVPDGAMEKALNVVINDDNTIEKTRGFYTYFDPTSLTLNALFFYDSKLLAVFTDRISYFTDAGSAPNLTGTKTDLAGQTIALTAPRVSRAVQQSGNFYFTTDNGVKKLTSYNATLFDSGSPQGLDVRGIFDTGNGIWLGNTQIAYRVVFGRRDANNNLLLGAPSDPIFLVNSPISNAPYTNPAANEIEITFIGNKLAVGSLITITAADDATFLGVRTVIASGFDPLLGVFRFDLGAAAVTPSGFLTYTVARAPIIEFSIPKNITSTTEEYFYQVYRTSQSNAFDSTPTPDYALVDEQLLTSAQITAKFVQFLDEVDATLLSNAPQLYTNPNSQEGELQANAKPPKAQDVDLLNGYVFYANCITRETLELDVVDTSNLANNDFVEIKVGATTIRYVARSGVGNGYVTADTATFVGTTITVTYATILFSPAGHGFSTGDTIFVSNAKGTGSLPSGTFTVTRINDTQFSFVAGAVPTTLVTLDFEGVTNGTNYIFQLTSTGDVGADLKNAGRGLVKAINRENVGGSSFVYANYVSNVEDVPGQTRITSYGFPSSAIYVRASSTTAGRAFSPNLPDSFASGTQVFSRNESLTNAIFVSKYLEPEATPQANAIFVGAKNKAILRIFALRDSVVVLKEDGVFKVTGDNPGNFTATLLDNTIFCVAATSASKANNSVYFLSNQGVCVATDSSVEIVSRKIERVINPVIGNTDIATATGALGYESARAYRVSTIAPNETTQTVTWSYNFLNDTWTESDVLFKGGVIGANDTLYIISTDDLIKKERKNQNKFDYCGQNYTITVTSVDAGKLSTVISSTAYVPVIGDVIIKSDFINRIDTVTDNGGNSYTVTFSRKCNLVAADSLQIYAYIESIVNFAPFHAGKVGLKKQFAQMTIHNRDNGIYRLRLSFSNESFGGSRYTAWNRYDVQGGGGWGELPWGYFPWGLPDGIDNQFMTAAGPPIRTWVPQFLQRSDFIKLIIENREACDPLNIQALAWFIRPYVERVSK